MTTKKKWEWNLKTGTLIVIPCVAARIVADMIAGNPIVSLITNAIVAAVSSTSQYSYCGVGKREDNRMKEEK